MEGQTFIHPLADVAPGAVLGERVRVGPFCHVGADVVLGDDVELVANVTVIGATSIGAGTKVYPQAALGAPPQNLRHKGSRTTLRIGANCIIREGVTMHTGSDSSRGETVVGDNGNFFAYCHVAHDCLIGRNASLANGALLAGHCELGDYVNVGGLTALHQFVRVGDYAFLSGMSAVLGDVVPFGMVAGNRATLRGMNVVGMRRAGFGKSDVQTLRLAYRTLFDRQHPLAENLARARADFAGVPLVEKVIAFMDGREKRPFCLPPVGRSIDDGADDED